MERKLIDARINHLDKRWDSVLRTFEMIGKSGELGFIGVSSMSNIQLLLSKVMFLWDVGVETHVLSEGKLLDMLP